MIRGWKWLVAASLLVLGCGGDARPRLVLLLTVDTLRADELGAYGSRRGLTPNLDALAAESTVFAAAYAPAAFTLPSVAGLLTGHHPQALGIRTNESGLPDGVPTLASALGAHGWQSGAVVGNFVLRSESGGGRGFDRFDDRFPRREAVRRWPERGAVDTTDAALELLSGCTELPNARCLLWVHYQDPHGPYEPPPGWRERFLAAERAAPDGALRLPAGSDHRGLGAIPRYQYLDGHDDVAWYRAGYRAEIAHMDAEVGRLLDAVAARRLADRAVIVFASDHGEALGDHDVWFAHGAGLTDDQVRVPLMFRIPGARAARRDDVATLLDVYPSLLGLLAIDAAPGRRGGRDLFAAGARHPAGVPYLSTLGALPDVQLAIVEDGFKFIATERGGVFDGRLHAVGREDADLAAASPQVASRLRERLAALRASTVAVVDAEAQQLDAEDRERLRALGYLEDEPEPD